MMNISDKEKTGLSSNALKGMQSVRATFTLPLNTINLLSIVSNQLGVKQKSIFEHLIEKREVLDQIKDEAKNYKPERKKRKQKTFVLSRSSLSRLDEFAKSCKLPRDLLVEFSVRTLRPVLDQEKKKHERRKTLLKEMEGFLDHGFEIIEKARDLVGEEDEAFNKLEIVIEQYEKSIEELKLAIEKGKTMEAYS